MMGVGDYEVVEAGEEGERTTGTQSVAMDSIFGVVYGDLFCEIDDGAF